MLRNRRYKDRVIPPWRTDMQGNIRIQFTMPEALTEWKMMAFAHTKDMAYGMLDGKIKTQKDLMVIPNLPRFLRQGDEIMLSSKISNLSDQQRSEERRVGKGGR